MNWDITEYSVFRFFVAKCVFYLFWVTFEYLTSLSVSGLQKNTQKPFHKFIRLATKLEFYNLGS